MVVTATQVTLYTDISANPADITASGLIPIVQERINNLTNNYFTSDKIYYQGTVTFGPTAYTIVAESNLHDLGFYSNDEFYLYNSYRNDGYFTATTVSAATIVIASSETVVEEPSGASVYLSVVTWPNAITYIAAQMVKYDYEDRANVTPGLESERLGPYAYTKSKNTNTSRLTYGYPPEIIDALSEYTVARLR